MSSLHRTDFYEKVVTKSRHNPADNFRSVGFMRMLDIFYHFASYYD